MRGARATHTSHALGLAHGAGQMRVGKHQQGVRTRLRQIQIQIQIESLHTRLDEIGEMTNAYLYLYLYLYLPESEPATAYPAPKVLRGRV